MRLNRACQETLAGCGQDQSACASVTCLLQNDYTRPTHPSRPFQTLAALTQAPAMSAALAAAPGFGAALVRLSMRGILWNHGVAGAGIATRSRALPGPHFVSPVLRRRRVIQTWPYVTNAASCRLQDGQGGEPGMARAPRGRSWDPARCPYTPVRLGRSPLVALGVQKVEGSSSISDGIGNTEINTARTDAQRV